MEGERECGLAIFGRVSVIDDARSMPKEEGKGGELM